MKTNKWILLLLSLSLILSACSGAIPSTETVPSLDDVLPPQVAAEVQNQISQALGVSIEDIQIESVESMEWPDSCLGLGGPEESCLEGVTPGWLVVYSINDEEFRYRVNETGTFIRQEP